MVSNQGAWQAQNMTHMFTFQDLRRPANPNDKLMVKIDENTLFGFLVKNPQFSKMAEIVIKSKMELLLKDKQADFTFFVTPNEKLENLDVSLIDVGLAKQIVKMSLIDRRISLKVLKQSPCRYLNTKNDRQRLFVTCLYERVVINDNAEIMVADMNVDNGVIHVVSNLLIPSEKTYMN